MLPSVVTAGPVAIARELRPIRTLLRKLQIHMKTNDFVIAVKEQKKISQNKIFWRE